MEVVHLFPIRLISLPGNKITDVCEKTIKTDEKLRKLGDLNLAISEREKFKLNSYVYISTRHGVYTGPAN